MMLSTAILLTLGLGVSAQHQHRGGMNQQGNAPMMHNMPMQQYTRMVNMIPMMQNQLSLSQEQVETLIDLQTAYRKT